MGTLAEEIGRNDCSACVILGDLTEEKDRHPSQLVNKIMGHLYRFARTAPTLVMMGNHDYHNEGSPFFAFIDAIDNLYWIDKVTLGCNLPNATLRDAFGDDVLLPHTRNHERDWKNVPWDTVYNAWAHNTFTGAETAQGKRLEGIDLKDIPEHVDIIAGDIHKPQQFGNLTYVGSPYSVDFGDDFKPRALIVGGSKVSSLSLAKYPQKVLAIVDDIGDLFGKKAPKVYPGDVVKLRIGIDDMGQWHAVHADARKWITDRGALPFRIEPILAKGIVQRSHEVKQTGTSLASEADVLRDYSKRHTDVTGPILDEGMDIIEFGADAVKGMLK